MRSLNKLATYAALSWTALAALSLAWNVHHGSRQVLEVGRTQARAVLEKDLLLRHWVAETGGLYAPVGPELPPNPYLRGVRDRDITAPSGRRLTLVDPAYLTRRLHELGRRKGLGVSGHLTSLKPLRPENAPDHWEAEALREFERGTAEVSGWAFVAGRRRLRLMRPLKVEADCLRCHAAQGYRLGDIRGGISASVPADPLLEIERRHIVSMSVGHGVLWLFGLLGIAYAVRRLRSSEERRRSREAEIAALLEGARAVLPQRRFEEAAREILRACERITGARSGYLAWAGGGGKAAEKLIREPAALPDAGPGPSFESLRGLSAEALRTGRAVLAGDAVLAPLVIRGQAPALLVVAGKSGGFSEGDLRIVEGFAGLASVALDNSRLLEEVEAHRDELDKEVRLRSGQMQAILDHSPAMIYAKDLEGRFLFVNRSFAEFFHAPPDRIVGKTDSAFLPKAAAERSRESDRKAIDSGGPVWADDRIPREGGDREQLTVKFPLKDSEGRVYAVCGISTDVTERKRLEARLFQAQKLDVLGRLSGGVAHDFNNLLTIIQSYAGFLLKGLPPDSPLRSDVGEVIEAADRASSLTRRLLAFSRDQAVTPREFRPAAAVREMVKMLRRLIGAHIELKLSVAEDAGPLFMDPSQFEQVIMNLAVNARDAMPQGGTLEMEMRNDSPAGGVLLRVTDTGCGIAREALPNIFDPFFTTKGQGEGAGLGLSAVYGIVQQNRGTIEVESAPGKGTTFRVRFPRREPA
ncbi:MAG: hypothetical protein A2X36_13645 [Elusimicrobia bacterium GWA2_69_24]|nr:MAG: hypothetical protein A2X36_13645 [Elusimicrobia bacterium GWA2_69_24]